MLSRNALSLCRHRSKAVFRRAMSTEVAQDTPVASSSSLLRAADAPHPRLATAIILNRSPIITRTPTAFERAFYAYQARIRRALHNPFPSEFYFKKGSLIETKFNDEESKREAEAFGTELQSSEDAVVDEAAEAAKAEALEQLAQIEGDPEDIMPRVHEADITRNVQSLDRKGKRNIYLLLQTLEDGKQVWRFPQGGVQKGELLHQAAQRDLYAECGEHMDVWVVSRNPIGVYKPGKANVPSDFKSDEYTFFYKAHILAGQVQPQGKHIQDFAWLTKQEIETRVDPEYWLVVKDILSDF